MIKRTPPTSELSKVALRVLIGREKGVPHDQVKVTEVKKALREAEEIILSDAVLLLCGKEHAKTKTFVRKPYDDVVRANWVVGPHGTGTLTNPRNKKKLNFEYEKFQPTEEMTKGLPKPLSLYDFLIEQVGVTFRVTAIDHETGEEKIVLGEPGKLENNSHQSWKARLKPRNEP